MTTAVQPSTMLATALIAPAGVVILPILYLVFSTLFHVRRLKKWWGSVPVATRHAWGRLVLAAIAMLIPGADARAAMLRVLHGEEPASLRTLAKMVFEAVFAGWQKRLGDLDGLVWFLVAVEGVVTIIIASQEAQASQVLDARVDLTLGVALVVSSSMSMATAVRHQMELLQRVAMVIVAGGLLLSLVTSYTMVSSTELVISKILTGLMLTGVLALVARQRWGVRVLVAAMAAAAVVSIVSSRSLDTPLVITSFVLGVVHGVLALALHRTYDSAATVWHLKPPQKR